MKIYANFWATKFNKNEQVSFFFEILFLFFFKLANTQKQMSLSFRAQNSMQKKYLKLYLNDEKWEFLEQERYFLRVKSFSFSQPVQLQRLQTSQKLNNKEAFRSR